VGGGAGDEFAAAFQCFFGELGSVASAAFGVDAAEIDVEESCAEGADLFSGGGAHVISFNNCAETAARGDGLESGYARADDENAGGRDRACRGYQHRE
jgi:hypothetical protein